MMTLRRWMRAFWQRPEATPSTIAHFGVSQAELTEYFERMVHKGIVMQNPTVVRRRMTDEEVKMLAIHIRGAMP